MIECKYCHKIFKSNISLGIHKNSCEGWKKELGIIDQPQYICECGKIFNKKRSLISHSRFCNKYKSLKAKPIISKRKISENEWQCECGKIFNNYQSLNAHMSHCDYHHEQIGTIRKLRPNEINHSMNWENKTENELQEIHKKAGITISRKIKDGELIPSFLGKTHSNESKEKIRISTINYIKQTHGKCKQRYSIKACKYIDDLNKQKGWNLQHAENGDEIQIGDYFLDGYDKDLNIAFEYDEPKHYEDIQNNILKDRDIERQKYIIEKLQCEFWRFNEKLNLLYRIN